MADVPGGMAIQGGCLHPPNGAILHRYRATGDEQISAVNVNPLPGDGHRVNRQTLASPLLSGREVRVACRDGLGRSTMDTAGGEDNSGVTLNTPPLHGFQAHHHPPSASLTLHPPSLLL